jgi:hypothetical protein
MINNVPQFKPLQTFTPVSTQRPDPSRNGHPHAPTHEQIARCAYDIYIEHGRAEGRSEQNWLQAEEELAHALAP